jgi:hypothetical protein
MSLVDLIRGKNTPDKFETATPATFATQGTEKGRTVASVATVAVAVSADAIPEIPVKGGTSDTMTISRWWRFHYGDREPKDVAYSPPVNHGEALAGEPDAISAEPFEPARWKPDGPLSTEEEAKIRKWLTHIGEADEAVVLEQCRTDADARRAYLQQVKDSDDKKRWSS